MNEMIKRRKRLTEAESAYFGRQILVAVQYLHENLVIHRDLKLGNLFLDRNMNIKVGDLGLATKLESADEKRKTICGTPNYIAPEVIQGDRATRGHSFEVDVWSMGVILYTCMCGRPPYEAKDVKATYQRILANEYSFPKDVMISDSAKDIIRSMLQSNPSDRPKLDQIATHPFFTQQPIPQSIPSTATHVAPQFVENEFGELMIASSKNTTLEASSKPGLPRAATSLRRPFASRDVNVDRASSSDRQKSAGKQGREVMEGAMKTALSAIANIGGTGRSPAPPPPSQPAFRVFDETESSKRSAIPDYQARKASPPSQASQMEEDIVSRTAAMSIRAQDASPFHADTRMTSPTGKFFAATPEQDTLILQNMIERIDSVLDVTSRRSYSHVHPDSPSLTAFARGGPPKWVSRYVDYTSKYGLGFLLNDGRYVYILEFYRFALMLSGLILLLLSQFWCILQRLDENCAGGGWGKLPLHRKKEVDTRLSSSWGTCCRCAHFVAISRRVAEEGYSLETLP
jgi:serine/threonine protein kinase